ncbi:MAG: hypothetical protein SGI72_02205 [Planctomycetota bacterium]|nr:hypothetical protein [Planctomycetota bacterium]
MQVLEQLKSMSPERFLTIYSGLELNGFGPLDNEVAKSLKFRPIAVKKLPIAQRAKRARMLIETSANAELAYEVFGAYLIRHHKGIVTGFLDKTGVAHEDGMIQDLDNGLPEKAKIAAAVTELDKSFAPEDVTLYLALCAQQWNQLPELDALWRKRSQ